MKEINYDKDNKKKLKIVKGDPKDLNISDVKDNLNFEIEENKNQEKKNIIIPKNKE